MVLDLRLVKIGCRDTINFFCTQASAAGNLEGGKGALPDRNGASINIVCVMNRLRSSVWIDKSEAQSLYVRRDRKCGSPYSTKSSKKT